GEAAIVPGVTVVPTPGETPGHLSVLITAGEQTAYYLGDLVHHVVEIEYPALVPRLAPTIDAATLVPSRQQLFQEAAANGGLIIGPHLHSPGTITQRADRERFRFTPLGPASNVGP